MESRSQKMLNLLKAKTQPVSASSGQTNILPTHKQIRHVPGEVWHPTDYDHCNFFMIIEQSELARLKSEFLTSAVENKISATPNVEKLAESQVASKITSNAGEVSVLYYRSKLSTYNLSIYNLKTNQAVCNVWHEGEGNRGAIEICTSVFQYIEKKASSTSQDISFIFYSDNCTGQQKNKYLIVMYMYALCIFRNIKSIEHKFLIKGHTQNEGDNVHSLIDKEIKRTLKSGMISVPSQYYQIMRTAKKKAPFYEVNEIGNRQFIDFKALSHELGENFTMNTHKETIPFSKIKILKVCRENPFTFEYKTSYAQDSYKEIDIFQSKCKRSTRASGTLTPDEMIQKLKKWTVKKAYNSPISIAPSKKKDLMYLVDNNYIKPSYFNFYNSL